MNSKGQALEILLEYGWSLIVIAIVVGVLVFVVTNSSENEYEIVSENFCRAWAEERGFTFIEGYYTYVLSSSSGWEVACAYSNNAEVFDGGISTGKREYKYFEISGKDLLEWADKEEPNPCCEECC